MTEPRALPVPGRFPRTVPESSAATQRPEPLESPPAHLPQRELETGYLTAPESHPLPREIGGPSIGR
jgi:hypothetical protein